MHLLTILAVAVAAVLFRLQPIPQAKEWSQRWYQTLFLFCFPGLLLLVTALTIVYMGCHGQMLGVRAGSVGCIIAGGSIFWASVCLLKLLIQNSLARRQLSDYPQQEVANTSVRILNFQLPYSAMVGFWHSELVVSQGLMAILDEEHLAAVIAHEQAHAQYKDTFWFFWLAWLRQFSCWLPNTTKLWQELLLLRELRADRRAAQSVDFLLLAESLLAVVEAPLESPIWGVGLNDAQIGDRLQERIDSLLDSAEPIAESHWHHWSWLGWLLLPLLTIPLHYHP